MIFSELCGAYYNAVAAILREATEHPVTQEELRKITAENAFSESVLTIEPALTGGKWPLLRPDGTGVTRFPPTMPLTLLQKRWLKAISLDPRIRLFDADIPGLDDVPPLFTPDDVFVFDRCADGDPFEDETYIRTFRLVLDAVRDRQPLSIGVRSRNGGTAHLNGMPEYLEYSEKDDKFRLAVSGFRHPVFVNLGRVLSCRPFCGPRRMVRRKPAPAAEKSVELELLDERNALERVLLHFAHFEKEARRLDERRYRVTVRYQRDDETEMVIRVLSFGPLIRVTEPESFAALIKERLEMQKSCGLG